jgi:LEM3 (ligand-effect modulator 3) family / CDC50 family
VSSSFKSSVTPQSVQWKRESNQTVTYLPQNVSVPDTNKCFLRFDLPADLHPPVLLYYRLTNFYQNHRRYVKSFDQAQLSGTARSVYDISRSECDKVKVDNATGLPFYPCGLIANSIFNDTYQSPQLLNPQGGNNNTSVYTMATTGIAWSSDAKLYGKTKYNGSEVVPPPNWIKRYPDYKTFMPDLSTDESLWVWMRTAGLPAFSKLAMRNDNQPMAKGTYEIEIWDGE